MKRCACINDHTYPARTIHWINVEMKFRTTSRRYFNYISTLFQWQMPAGYGVKL